MSEPVSMAIMFLSLGLAYALVFYFTYALIVSIKHYYKKYQIAKKYHEEIQRYIDRHQAMRESGDMHEYVSIPNGQFDEEGKPLKYLVCKKTYWCPEIDNYLTQSYVNNKLAEQKNLEDFENFKKELVGYIARTKDLPPETVDSILNEYFEAKKKYYLDKMKLAIRDIEKESGNNAGA